MIFSFILKSFCAGYGFTTLLASNLPPKHKNRKKRNRFLLIKLKSKLWTTLNAATDSSCRQRFQSF